MSSDNRLTNSEGVDPQITDIMRLLSQVSRRFEPEAGETKARIAKHFQRPELIELLQDMTITMLRVLDTIGRLEPVNGITISKHSRIPKGSVSKITRRLIGQKLVSKESLPNNKKEILFRLTPLGSELFHAHRAFDEEMEQGFVTFLQRYEAHELGFITRMLQDVLDAPWLGSNDPHAG